MHSSIKNNKKELMDQREKDLLNLFQFQQDAILIFDNDARVQFVNSAFLDSFGFDEQQLLGKEISELPLSGQQKDVKSRIESMINDASLVSSPEKFDCFFLNAKKEEIFSEVLISPLRGIDKNQVVVLIKPKPKNSLSLLDKKNNKEYSLYGNTDVGLKILNEKLQKEIDIRKDIQGSLYESKEKYRLLFESSPLAIVVLKGNLEVIECNGNVLDFLKIKNKEDIIGKNGHEFFVNHLIEGNMDLLKKNLNELLEKGQDSNIYKLRRLDGVEIIVESFSTVVFDKEKRPEVMIMTFMDITERKKLEGIKDKLLQEVQEKNKEMESFVYTVSHDLKGPLISIDGFSSLLEKEFKDVLDSKGMHFLNRLRINVDMLEEIINSLLELSRVGRVIGEKKVLHFLEMATSLKRDFSLELKKMNIELLIHDENVSFLGDEGRMRQVFKNLLQNAIRFMGEQKTPKIGMGVLKNDANQNLFTFYVKDNGIGIAKRNQDDIFQVFYRLEDVPTKGTGIGLAIVKKIVEHHGGSIWVESEKGKGATFYFTVADEKERK